MKWIPWNICCNVPSAEALIIVRTVPRDLRWYLSEWTDEEKPGWMLYKLGWKRRLVSWSTLSTLFIGLLYFGSHTKHLMGLWIICNYTKRITGRYNKLKCSWRFENNPRLFLLLTHFKLISKLYVIEHCTFIEHVRSCVEFLFCCQGLFIMIQFTTNWWALNICILQNNDFLTFLG